MGSQMKLNLKERATNAKGWVKTHPNLIKTAGIALATSTAVVALRVGVLTLTEGE